jgi:biopolymer transport protein ExbD
MRHKKKRRSVPVPVTSMGDIAFLLIIFFLVCSDTSKERSLALDLPKSDSVKKTKVTVAARISLDKEGILYFDGQPVEGPKHVEELVLAKLANTVADDQRHVQFSCDAALPKEQFEPVIQAIVEAGGILEAVGEKKQ